jgi:hypothetical protein
MDGALVVVVVVGGFMTGPFVCFIKILLPYFISSVAMIIAWVLISSPKLLLWLQPKLTQPKLT